MLSSSLPSAVGLGDEAEGDDCVIAFHLNENLALGFNDERKESSSVSSACSL
jgi:hypothetical protein